MRIADFRFRNKKAKFLNSAFRIPHSEMGLTLLEIAISLAILAIALVALANLFPVGLRASRRAMDYSSASILAQRVIENIKTAASIDDASDVIDRNFANRSDIIVISNGGIGNGIGYLELARQDTGPFWDSDAKIDNLPFIKYDYNDTDMDVYIKVEDWDANGNNLTGLADGDLDDVLLSQKVYVAIYWTEADRDRAETFITYISNPFYEKYK